jgi:signal peptidase I
MGEDGAGEAPSALAAEATPTRAVTYREAMTRPRSGAGPDDGRLTRPAPGWRSDPGEPAGEPAGRPAGPIREPTGRANGRARHAADERVGEGYPDVPVRANGRPRHAATPFTGPEHRHYPPPPPTAGYREDPPRPAQTSAPRPEVRWAERWHWPLEGSPTGPEPATTPSTNGQVDKRMFAPGQLPPRWTPIGGAEPTRPAVDRQPPDRPGTRSWLYSPLPPQSATGPWPVRPEPAASLDMPPVDGAPPLDEDATQLLHRYVPAREVLDREEREAPADTSELRSHPPRAVVRRRRARRRLLEWPLLVVVALLSAYFIRTYVVQTFYIPSGSMHETLLEGDRVLVNKIGYHMHDVHRGDVIVFHRPPNFQVEDEDLIKRVIALPGETVQGIGRKVLVNGRALNEPYVEPACRGTDPFPPVTVPAGHLWVMGDNRCDSSDSRVFGPIEKSLVVGRAFVLVWPPGRIAWL